MKKKKKKSFIRIDDWFQHTFNSNQDSKVVGESNQSFSSVHIKIQQVSKIVPHVNLFPKLYFSTSARRRWSRNMTNGLIVHYRF